MSGNNVKDYNKAKLMNSMTFDSNDNVQNQDDLKPVQKSKKLQSVNIKNKKQGELSVIREQFNSAMSNSSSVSKTAI